MVMRRQETYNVFVFDSVPNWYGYQNWVDPLCGEFCLDYMVQRDQLVGSFADKVREEFSKVVGIPSVKSSLAAFRRNEYRLDSFWKNILADTGLVFPNLITFLKKILILSHGNAALERGFSVNKECLIVNMLDQSLVTQRVTHDAILQVGNVSARNARGRYQESLEKKKKDKQQEETEASKKRENTLAIKKLETKKAKILAEAQKETALIDEEMKSLIR